ncbi:efflux transporter outer membrane subunit [Aquirhabdus sp.]|uniref:efflux transporter outer membrane subunit n=1 Tax=Aquirhabdus sp. TaxID=2824160 RepID=UPI00396CED89
MNDISGTSRFKLALTWAPLTLAILVASCASLPDADPAPRLNNVHSTDFVPSTTGQWPAATWWQDFQDPQLNQLIDQALKGSPSIAVAQARVFQAQAATEGASANRGMKLTADASANASQYYTRINKNNVHLPPIQENLTGGNAMASLKLSYDFDFWGKNRKALEAALGREAASRAEAAGAAASLSSSVASTYFQWQVLNQRIAVQIQIAGYQQHLLDIELKRQKAGLSSGNDVAPLRANAALPQQTLVQLQSQRDETLSQLKSLVASGQDFPALTVQPLPKFNGELPANLPLELIARRTDIVAARDRVTASLSDVESARAAFYPDINLSANAGISHYQFGNLLALTPLQAGVTPAISLPLFDSGRLRASLNSNRAEVALAVAQYDQSIQNAVNEINDAALHVQGADHEADPLQHQVQAREHELTNTQRLIKAGLQDGRNLMGIQLSKANLQDQEIARQGRALQAHVDLIKALGGGYQAEPNTVQADAKVTDPRTHN